jgi:hypothetical protein
MTSFATDVLFSLHSVTKTPLLGSVRVRRSSLTPSLGL